MVLSTARVAWAGRVTTESVAVTTPIEVEDYCLIYCAPYCDDASLLK